MDGLIAMVKANARPPAWCEEFVRDTLAGRNLEVVDDEAAPGPRWITTGNGSERKAAPILDEDFRDVRTADGSRVASGYVTLRWRKDTLVVLRVESLCYDHPIAAAGCNPPRFLALFVYDDSTPIACNLSFVERPYWPNWQRSMTPILAREAELARQGIPARKDRKAARPAGER
ncbi:MAG: hypothetical protein V4844_22315 [Pseudomonadota bacterium]